MPRYISRSARCKPARATTTVSAGRPPVADAGGQAAPDPLADARATCLHPLTQTCDRGGGRRSGAVRAPEQELILLVKRRACGVHPVDDRALDGVAVALEPSETVRSARPDRSDGCRGSTPKVASLHQRHALVVKRDRDHRLIEHHASSTLWKRVATTKSVRRVPRQVVTDRRRTADPDPRRRRPRRLSRTDWKSSIDVGVGVAEQQRDVVVVSISQLANPARDSRYAR